VSREKPLHRYAQEYYDLCKKAHTEDITMWFGTPQQAKNFRIEMYLFRKALRRALLNDPDNEELQIHVLFAEGLQFSIDGNDLIIAKKKSKAAELISEVL